MCGNLWIPSLPRLKNYSHLRNGGTSCVDHWAEVVWLACSHVCSAHLIKKLNDDFDPLCGLCHREKGINYQIYNGCMETVHFRLKEKQTPSLQVLYRALLVFYLIMNYVGLRQDKSARNRTSSVHPIFLKNGFLLSKLILICFATN